MSNIFQSVKTRRPKRSKFDLSHEVKLTCNMAQLVPVLCQDIVPGDEFKVTTESLVRLAPMIAPVMHRVDVYTHYFFVPNRLIWDEWEDFITKGVDGTDAPVSPYFAPFASKTGELPDYFGLPTDVTLKGISSLPFRAYSLIWNEYYRDQNLQDEFPLSRSSGVEDVATEQALRLLRYRCWEKDYFTSALPWTQRGPEVMLPLNGTAPVVVNDTAKTPFMRDYNFDPAHPAPRQFGGGDLVSQTDGTLITQSSPTAMGSKYDPNGTLEADLSQASSTTINELRRSIALQRWFENNARAGSRYKEQILAHFGVISPDARLQRPEYLGGGRTPVVMSEVLQTSSSDNTSPQANMAGHGISGGTTNQFKRFFQEHGWVIGIMSIMPRTGYQQGIPRKFTRSDNMEYAFPEFAHLGEQSILNKELFVTGTSADDDVFGYTPRYAEYKYEPSRVHGDFRKNLSFWHLGRIFDNAPKLNSAFVTSNPSQRIFAVNDDSDKFWIQLVHYIHAKRPLPYYGTPSII